jgi:hypothetical protein
MAAKPFIFYDARGRVMSTPVSEAARGSKQRASHTGFNRDAAALFPGISRETLMSLGRWLYTNSSLVAGAVNEQAQIISGDVSAQFAGEDMEWGEEAELWMDDHNNLCDVRGVLYPMATLHSLWMSHIIRDGDVGVILTEGAGGYPFLQTIPAHRIHGDGLVMSDSPYFGRQLIDGVIVNEVGRPLAYRVYDDRTAKYQDISSTDMLLRFMPRYADQLRGHSSLACAVMDFQDVDQIRRFELIAQQVASSLAIVETNETGLPPDTAETMLRDGGEYNSDTDTAYHEMQGGTIRYFRSGTGGKIEALKADRPTPAQQQFADSIIRQAFAGMGWSIDFFLDPRSVNGGAMRVLVERINRSVGAYRKQCLFPMVKAIDAWRIAKAMKVGLLRYSDDWFRWRYNGAADLTADAKYLAQVHEMQMARGLLSPQMATASTGRDWQVVQDESISWWKRWQERCKTEGVDPSVVTGGAPPVQQPEPQPLPPTEE